MHIKVAIVDDHNLIAEGVSNMLRYNAEMDIIAAYPDGKSLLESLPERMPDVLLLDINMPGMPGDELAAILKRQYPAIRIIALTSFDNIFYIKNMLQQKIDGYLLKHVSRDILMEAIRIVYEHGTYLDETVSRQIQRDEEITKRQKEAGTLLTKREKEILQLIAEGHTGSEIAEKLFLSKRTVEHHRESVLAKLGCKKISLLILKAKELGLLY